VGKVCDLCRVLENWYISRTHSYEHPWDPIRLEEQMVTFMMVNSNDEYNPDLWCFLLDGVPLGNNWVITKTWLYL
jgi:hypothetical protein